MHAEWVLLGYFLGFAVGVLLTVWHYRLNDDAVRNYGADTRLPHAIGVSIETGKPAQTLSVQVVCSECEAVFAYTVGSARGEAVVECPNCKAIGSLTWAKRNGVISHA